ncbi:DUF500-domain-containing protein [Basidiobolus meristosporus CBS 931.73]|uniref:DUF500-domain-containing protein n=1 Tax=Basidiobolus meristosporus CBS 931.73 TaxID=1314790 RepID=A0A1Y1XZT0_9FUNG|nr:DUF500-domain-containing protein [Basidiobolus meristosporus CBS 931.73]|eukprot:ORX91218.1 DUF500-domain-containing protein [Basidiobolus meristosporus CBS 931.73]
MVNPLPSDLAGECRKASKIINSFIDTSSSKGPDAIIPSNILNNAKGLAIFTVIKAGFLWSGRVGTGVVVARLPDGSWSGPSCIGTGGMGFGGQVGAEVTDFVVILNTLDAVKAFSHGGNVTLGGNLSVAAGPIGRNAEAAGTVGNLAAIYSYSKTKGLFAGVSIEGSVIVERKDANAKFYGRRISAKEILNGSVPAPPEAGVLLRALNIKANRSSYASYSQSVNNPYESNGSGLNRSMSTATSSMGRSNGLNRSMSTATNSMSRNNYTSGYNTSNYSNSHESKPNYLGERREFDSYKPSEPATAPPYYSDRGYQNVSTSPAQGRVVPPPPTKSGEPTATALYSFDAIESGDLPFKQGDIIVILKKTESQNDWWKGRCNGREGNFPANYVRIN